MPKHEQKPGERWKSRPPRRILRWLLRFVAWSSVVTVATVGLVAILAFLVYLNRARIVNDALDRFVEPFDVSVEKIDLYPIGEVAIQNLRLSPKGAELDEPTLFVPETLLTYEFQTLRQDRQLKSILLKNPVVRLEDKTLKSFQGPKKSPAAPLDFSQFGIFTDSLIVEDGQLTLDLDGLPAISGKWNAEAEAFEFDEEGLLEKPISLELTDIQVEEGGTLAQLSTALSLQQDLSEFVIPFLNLSGIEARITPEWFSRDESASPRPDDGSDTLAISTTDEGARWTIRDISLGKSTISIEGFDGKDATVPLPDIQFDGAFQLEELRFAGGRFTTPGPVELELSDIAIGPTDSQFAAGSRLIAKAESLQSVIEDQTFSSIDLDGVEVVMTDETLSRSRMDAMGNQTEDPPAEPGRPWVIETFRLTESSYVMRDTTFGESPAPHLETAVAGTLRDLRFGGADGFASREKSEIRISNTRLWAPGVTAGTDPLLQLNRAEIAGTWAEFDFDGTLDRIALRDPRIQFTDESLGDWLTAADTTGEEIGPQNRPVYKISEFEVTGGKLIADSQFAQGKVPKLVSDFSVETVESEEADPFDYRFLFENLTLRSHAIELVEAVAGTPAPSLFPEEAETGSAAPEEEVLSVRSIELSATAEELQRDRRIGKMKLTGAVLHVGEGLKNIVDSNTPEETEDPVEPSPEPAPEPPAAENSTRELPTWLLEEVQITQSQVRFESLIPQISGLEFAIETTLTDIPLSPDGLLAQDALQKVELAGLEIKDPYNSFITVAFLPTIFVEFSLAGLARQEVEKIDLIAPSLHVGQGLFWWIDYQRKFREQNEGASVGIENEDAMGTSPDWEIKTINASAGKIVIAPTGIPIGMVPFPFNATTNMQDGRIELKLEIPDEEGYVYSFPDYEVDLYGLTGNIEFNVPIKQVSNNLVQVFELDRFVWKDYEAENLFLSVTFDENGVYGELGGDAYSGYAEGGFNFYLNDPGKWDAWVAGTAMDTRPITSVLVPDNFLMEGLISLKLISEGRDKVLGETTGEIQTAGPGWFDITKLDGILDNLPEEWTNLQRSLTELGLIALKRFDYDKGAGSLYLLGRDGNLDLRFVGPYGSRELNLHLHDERNTTAQVTPQTDTPDNEDAATLP